MFRATGVPGWARATSGGAAAAVPTGISSAEAGEEKEIDLLKQHADEASELLEQLRQRISRLEGETGQ
jgi:hypothetical protein